MKLTVLGCGDAFGSNGRYNTSFLVNTGSHSILVDCGASTLIRLKQMNISPEEIDAIVITHFHGDHYGGIPFLVISNKFEYKREKKLAIYGPEGVKDKVYNLQDALYPGTSELLDEMNITVSAYTHEFLEILPDVSVRGLPVTHAAPSNPHGVQVKLGDKLFGFSGDTEWDDNIPELADQTDLFIIECNNLKTDSPGHIGYQTINEKKDLLNTQRLMLTHMGSEMISGYDIDVERLYDGMELEF